LGISNYELKTWSIKWSIKMVEAVQVTIVVTQRERFSYTKPSLESIYAHTKIPFHLIYVDGNSPPHVKRYLKEQAQQRQFKLIRREQYLFPNQARNLALRQVNTPYVVLLDNDALVTQGWLAALIQCAQETAAWSVAPLYLEGLPEDGIVHLAGGDVGFSERQGRKTLFRRHRFLKRPLARVQDKLQRMETGYVEFHCVLVRTEVFTTVGFLDEQFLSHGDDIDLSLSVRAAGGKLYFEPSAIVSYVSPPPFEESDLPFFLLRWGDEWNRMSLEHLCEKWELAADSPSLKSNRKWLLSHRQLAARKSLHKVFGVEHGSWLSCNILTPIENRFFV
jgi:GT2 family glycosyltransferase